MILLVCGSRTWDDEELIRKYLDSAFPMVSTVIHGDAPGADRIAGRIAENMLGVEVLSRPADWDRYGKSTAGRIRNLEMLLEATTRSADLSHDDGFYPHYWQEEIHVLAFYKGEFSAGTQMMLNYCKRYGIPYTKVREDGTEEEFNPLV